MGVPATGRERWTSPADRRAGTGRGRASRLFPELDRELESAAPEAVDLDTRGALRFLKETGPLLAGAGFGAVQGLISDQAASGLHLGKFRHLFVPLAR